MIARLFANTRLTVLLLLLGALNGMGGMFFIGQRLAEIEHRIRPSAAEEQRRLHAQLRVDAVVDDLLGGLADDIGADRTLVFLAHNGRTDLSGQIPFLYLSNANVHLRAGVDWQEAWSRAVPLSTYSALMRRMFRNPDEPRCVRRDRSDPDLSVVGRARMAERGVEVSFVCPLQGPHGVVGLVSAEFMRREAVRLTDTDVLERVAATSRHAHAAMVAVAAR